MRFLSTLVASTIGTLLAFGVIVLFLFLFLFALSLSSGQAPPVTPGSVLVVDIEGPIPERMSDDPFATAFAGSDRVRYDLRDLKGALQKAAADDRIDGVWLRLRQTSAAWATLGEVRDALDAFKESGKPLIASSADFGMSEKTYYLASAADSAFAAPQAPFEFNGFQIMSQFFKGALDKLDVQPEVIRAGEYKSAVEPFTREDLSDPNRTQLTALLNAQNEQFMQHVAASRGRDAEALNQLARESALLSADQAVEEGLIDSLRYEDEVHDIIKTRLGMDADANLRTISVPRYANVPASDAGLQPASDGEVAIVYAEGQIISGSSEDIFPGSQAPLIGSTTFSDAMEEARTNANVNAVVVRVNSPGGSAAASEVMWRAVELTTREKPVIVSMGDYAASGGYYIAAGADSIVANPQTITGSIGVFGILFDASGLFENKLGITFDGVSTSPYADMFSGVEPLSDAEHQLLERNIDATYDRFLQRVADGRGMSVEEVDAVAQGRVWAGQDALNVGLVDTLGTLDDAVRIAAQKAGMGEGPYRVRTLPRMKTFFERLNESLYGQAATLWTEMTTSPAERMLMEQRRTLQDLARTHGTAQMRLPVDIRIE